MDIQGLLEIDRQLLLAFNGSGSLFIDSLVLVLTNAYTWIAFCLALAYLVIKNNGKWSQIMLVVAASGLCILLSSLVAEGVVKPYVARLRPSLDPSVCNMLHLAKGYTASGYSFFSAHAANTFSIAVFFSLLVRSRVFTIFIMAWSLLNAWTRLYLGVHYPSDVIVGLAYGAFVGIMVYLIFMKLYMIVTDKLHFISSQYTRTGYGFSDIDIVHNVLLLTIVYAVIHAAVSAF
ncbi:MAG: phosphatase PAP2 family protein [Prevotella sp.]|nr:phosphatase PAP2 family protein [Prevotella sp.]